MITIIDYRAGNLTSVRLACESLGLDAKITSDPVVIKAAKHVIFPGVGAAGAAMGTPARNGTDRHSACSR